MVWYICSHMDAYMYIYTYAYTCTTLRAMEVVSKNTLHRDFRLVNNHRPILLQSILLNGYRLADEEKARIQWRQRYSHHLEKSERKGNKGQRRRRCLIPYLGHRIRVYPSYSFHIIIMLLCGCPTWNMRIFLLSAFASSIGHLSVSCIQLLCLTEH